MKNLSHKNLWTTAFLEGNDKPEMLKANLRETFQQVTGWKNKSLKMKEQPGKPEPSHRTIVLLPCDMSTHNSLTDAEHMTCFRCGRKHAEFRVMFTVVEDAQCTLQELAEKTLTSSKDLLQINTADPHMVRRIGLASC